MAKNTQSQRTGPRGGFFERLGKTFRGGAQHAQNAVLSKDESRTQYGVSRFANPGRPATQFSGTTASYGGFSNSNFEVISLGDFPIALGSPSQGLSPDLVGHLWQGFETMSGNARYIPVGPDLDEILSGYLIEASVFAEDHPIQAGAVGFGTAVTATSLGAAAVATGLAVNRGVGAVASQVGRNIHNSVTARPRGGGGGSPLAALTRQATNPRYNRYTLPIMNMF